MMSSRYTSSTSWHSSAEKVEAEEVFPRKLPEISFGPLYDESGFTLSERIALRQAWGLIKPFERRYGKEILFDFLMKHYKTFDSFRFNGRIDLRRMHHHSVSFMRFIGSMIELKDPVALQILLSDNTSLHRSANVTPVYLEMIVKSLISYILDKLKDVCSASLESGFRRLQQKFHNSMLDVDRISVLSSYTNLDELDEIFPKKLPELIVGPVYDECGFTLNERLALRQAWRVIKPLERRYGKLIYFDFLMEHYKSIESFRHNGKLDLYRLHNHSLAVMRFISSIIEQNDPAVFQAVLTDNYNMHCRAHVNPEYIKIIARALINYVLDKLKDICSASLESGFERLLAKFNALYSEEKSKGLSFMFRRSQSKDISKSIVSVEPE